MIAALLISVLRKKVFEAVYVLKWEGKPDIWCMCMIKEDQNPQISVSFMLLLLLLIPLINSPHSIKNYMKYDRSLYRTDDTISIYASHFKVPWLPKQ